MTKAAMQRLKKSDFFREVCALVIAWDYYLRTKNDNAVDECANRWSIAQLALQHITGNMYRFARNDETVSIVNMYDRNDTIFSSGLFGKQNRPANPGI